MNKVLILARTLSDGNLWQAWHFEGSPEWVWHRATEGEADIMGHLVLTIPVGSFIPTGPGTVVSAMLPGAAGEGATHP